MNMRLMTMMACLSTLLGAGACDLPDENIGDETQGMDSAGDSGEPGDECEPGEQVPAADGCNTCTCDEDGFLACTEIACEPDPPLECEPGTMVPADDGCNECYCEEDGTIGACTEIACEPDPPLECEPGTTVPAGDGCNECYCEEDGTIGACSELACDGEDTDPFDGPELSSCEPSTPFDSLVVEGATVEGDPLTIDVAYSGCGPGHPLGGCWNGLFLESEPVQVNIDVAHDDLGEVCEAFPSDSVDIDLTPLRESYQEFYGEAGTIMINIAGLDGAVEYTF